MNHPSQEDLLGYVLGALDAPEQRQLEQLIDEYPEIEERLLAIKSSLVPLDYLETSGHRPGLARRTCESVASVDLDEIASRLQFLDAPALADDQASIAAAESNPIVGDAGSEPGTQLMPAKMAADESKFGIRMTSWSLVDVLAGVAVMAIFAGILFPVLSFARYNSRLTACQNNLRQVGFAFQQYSNNHGGGFPKIPETGNLAVAGAYGPLLKECGLIEDGWLACPGLGTDQTPVSIPSVEQIEAASSEQEVNYCQQAAGGHYGYTMGYFDRNGYIAPRNMGQAYMVLLADRPSPNQPGRGSVNHGGSGQNVLFADGSAKFVSGNVYGSDALYVNDYGVVAPGSNMFDNVIASSHLSPIRAIEMNRFSDRP